MSKTPSDDPFSKKSTIASTLEAARKEAKGGLRSESKQEARMTKQMASLKNPTRPFTPADITSRSLFHSGSSSRPQSAVVINQLTSEHFLEELQHVDNDSELHSGRGKSVPVTPPSSLAMHKQANQDEFHEEDQYEIQWKKLRPLLQQLKAEKENIIATKILAELSVALDSCDIPMLKEKRRLTILKLMYKFVDTDHPTLLFKIAKIALQLKDFAKGSTLLYKLSKEEKNDSQFQQENLLELLLRIVNPEIQDDLPFEAILYSMGTLKNATSSESNQIELGKLGAVEILTNWLNPSKIEAQVTQRESSTPKKSGPEKVAQLLIQVTATLRNLSLPNTNKANFIESNCLSNIFHLLEPSAAYANRYELMLNVSRILSKLSLFPECRTTIMKNKQCVLSVLHLLEEFSDQTALVVRLAFVLGNITAHSEQAREFLAVECSCIPVTVGLLLKYAQKDKELHPSSLLEQKGKNENEEVMIKLVRLLANLSISESIGPQIARMDQLKLLVSLLASKSIQQHEELVLNVIGAITNLSYYTMEPDNVVLKQQTSIAKLIIPYLMNENEEAVIESARAFGNFSRSKQVRDLITKKRVDEMLVLLLDHSNREVIYNVCGVLMNLMTEHPHKHAFAMGEGIEKLCDVLQEAIDTEDSVLCTIACKTLWNFSLDNTNGLAKNADVLHQLLAGCVHKFEGMHEKPEVAALVQVAHHLLELLPDQ